MTGEMLLRIERLRARARIPMTDDEFNYLWTRSVLGNGEPDSWGKPPPAPVSPAYIAAHEQSIRETRAALTWALVDELIHAWGIRVQAESATPIQASLW